MEARQITGPSSKPLHQTRRGGVAHFVRRGPVVEARLAGEGRCSTHVPRSSSTAAATLLAIFLCACTPSAAAHAKEYLPPGTPEARVEELLGEPSSRMSEARDAEFFLDKSDGCGKGRVDHASLYNFWSGLDVLVAFDIKDRVVCVRQRGGMFRMVHN